MVFQAFDLSTIKIPQDIEYIIKKGIVGGIVLETNDSIYELISSDEMDNYVKAHSDEILQDIYDRVSNLESEISMQVVIGEIQESYEVDRR